MEACVATTLTSHLEQHNLYSRHQWAYKKYHSTEMLMVKMMEDWRRGLDNRQVVGVLCIDLKKVFDSVSHPILLNKLHGLGISGDIWFWIIYQTKLK
jgi:hypothetical protein